MIRNWEEHNLHMDYQNIQCPKGRPSDIDMFYIARNGFLIIGEIKNSTGEFSDGQRWLLSRLIDNHRGGGTILFITHDKFVQKGDSVVDVSKCPVVEYYWHGRWHKPKQPTTVNEAFAKLLNGIL